MDEEKKNEILGEKYDTEEMEAVSGGGSLGPVKRVKTPDTHGGCNKNYYRQDCTATVEKGSHCWSNDWCIRWSETYSRV